MISIAELRTIPLFATLPDSEATVLAARMADVRLRTGDWLSATTATGARDCTRKR